MKHFESQKGGVPFPRSADEWLPKVNPETGDYFTPKEAEHKIAKDVFGHDYQSDKSGAPIERGKGSALQPTAQHQQALMIAQDAEAGRRMRMGWHPGLDQGFDPRSAPAARARPKKKAARRKVATVPAAETA